MQCQLRQLRQQERGHLRHLRHLRIYLYLMNIVVGWVKRSATQPTDYN